ncbi:MAG: hypothetical protein AAGU19_19095 [Prolixibacteraceae bacterium]
MRTIKNMLWLLFAAGLFSCQKDPMADITDGKWNKERNIINITFEGQVGEAVITREGDAAVINFTYNTDAGAGFGAINISAMELSYGATASVKPGDALNFENAEKSAVITVTPANGDPLSWTVQMTPFTETLIGTWDITGLWVYGGTGPEYGGAAVLKMSDKSWCWPAAEGPAKEQDNTLTFAMTGISPEGNTYGTVVNNAGADGVYANFLFVSKTPNIDVNHFYRAIPKGAGTWMRNYATGTVTFTFPDGTSRTAMFDGPGTYDLGNSKSRTLITPAFTFTLQGVDDWGSIYSDYDKFVKRPRKYWVDVRKK